MSVTQLTAAHLHDPVLPLVQPVSVTLRTGQTVAEAHAAVRATPSGRDLVYLYVLDSDQRLAGVVPAWRLLTAEPGVLVQDVMLSDVVAIPSWATVLIASEFFATRKLQAFPVIDDDGTLVGTVDVRLFTGEIIGVAQETYDDIFQLLGIHATAVRTPWTSFCDRCPWLLSNVVGGLLCAFIAARFELLLQDVVVLALFIPVVLSLAESVGMQSATLTLHGLSSESVQIRRLAAGLWREGRTAVLLGLSAGAVVATVILVWRSDPMSSVVVGGAIAVSVLAACLLGVLLPTLVRVCRADPRIAAGPLVLAATDVLALAFYLGLGAMVLGG